MSWYTIVMTLWLMVGAALAVLASITIPVLHRGAELVDDWEEWGVNFIHPRKLKWWALPVIVAAGPIGLFAPVSWVLWISYCPKFENR